MTILFLLRSLEYGGAERQLVLLAKGLLRRGHRVTVATFYSGGPLEQELRTAGISILGLDKRGRWDLVGFARRLIHAVRQIQPDIIHSYLTDPNLIAALLKVRFPRSRIAWGVRDSAVDSSTYDWLFRLGLRLTSLLSRVPDAIIVNSHAGYRDYAALGYSAPSMVVIPNGIDTARFVPDRDARERTRREWGVRSEDTLIGIVGRVAPMKDHATFLYAADLLRRENPTLRFVVVGDGPSAHRASMQRLAQSLGLNGRVHWRKAQQDLVGPYNALDLLVNSSCEGEGFGNVIAEAMACGIPCVVTNVGDSASIVGNYGAVVPPRDRIALAQAIQRAVHRSGTDRGDIRRSVEQRFSVERLILHTESVLDSLVRGTSAAVPAATAAPSSPATPSSDTRATANEPQPILTHSRP